MNEEPKGPDIASHLTELEEKIAFQQRALEQLNEVVLAQQAQLDSQRRELASFRKLMGELAERTPGEDLPHEKPPHY